MEQHLWRVRDAAALRARAHASAHAWHARSVTATQFSRAHTRTLARSPLARSSSSSSSPVAQSSPPLGSSSSDTHAGATLARVRFESIHVLLDSSSSLPSSPTPLTRKRTRDPESSFRRVQARVENTPAACPGRHLAQRTPESPHSLVLGHCARTRLLGKGTPRTPGATWSDDPPSDFSLPAIQVTPPACEIESVVARSALEHTAPAGQREFAAKLLAADHAALERLTWRIDLAMAGIACAEDAPRATMRAAKSTATLLMEAWNPTSAAALASSPPSLRMNPDVSIESGSMLSGSTQLAAQYRTLGTVGGETALAVANHLANTAWYMALRDPRRTFPRPGTLAEYLAHLGTLLAEWETLEQSMHARQLPVHHLADIECCSIAGTECSACLPVSAVIRRLIPVRLRKLFSEVIEAQARTALLRASFESSNVSIIDVCRFLGELFKHHSTVDADMVSSWLTTLLGEPLVPARIEGACALLLLAYPRLQRRFVCHSQGMLSSPQSEVNVLGESISRLAKISASPQVPPQLGECIKVSRATKQRVCTTVENSLRSPATST
ncbi:hypothetical protein MCUN1_000607 [Malassezia cuniculi]|uniref:Uncharacterized protein n=1 Tax=Malassezia cuniculi TaxID=948313 RepID=A0AAF0EPA1_9BASI|nr:hypothetical protein MCUN1_000607 [Malassezia cuniculi]